MRLLSYVMREQRPSVFPSEALILSNGGVSSTRLTAASVGVCIGKSFERGIVLTVLVISDGGSCRCQLLWSGCYGARMRTQKTRVQTRPRRSHFRLRPVYCALSMHVKEPQLVENSGVLPYGFSLLSIAFSAFPLTRRALSRAPDIGGRN